jgi:hypothetical protein
MAAVLEVVVTVVVMVVGVGTTLRLSLFGELVATATMAAVLEAEAMEAAAAWT